MAADNLKNLSEPEYDWYDRKRWLGMPVTFTKYKLSEAMENEIQEKLNRTKIYAPFNGAIIRKLAELGAYVSPGTPLVEIVSDGQADALFHINEKLMAEAKQITNLENPNSVSQLAQWFEKATNEKILDLRKDTVARMLQNQAVTGSAKRMLEIRQELGKTSTKKYDAIEAGAFADCYSSTELTARAVGRDASCRCRIFRARISSSLTRRGAP